MYHSNSWTTHFFLSRRPCIYTAEKNLFALVQLAQEGRMELLEEKYWKFIENKQEKCIL